MKTKLQFTLSKLGIAWMFALVTVNFNRVAIFDLAIPAVLVCTMIGLYPFFGPFQPMFRRLSDRRPILGYRISPYLVIGMVLGSLVFPALPSVAAEMARGSAAAMVLGFGLFFFFGLMIALMANTYLDLIAVCTREDERGGVFAAAWTGQTAILVVWAMVFRAIMPAYSPERMQLLYSVTPLVVAVLAIASVWKLEPRLSAGEIAAIRRAPPPADQTMNSIRSSLLLLRNNASARMFFVFITFTFLGIFTQDLVQEVFAGDVFGLNAGDSAVFQQVFNGMVTVGMGMTAALGPRVLGFGTFVKADALPMRQKKRVAYAGAALATASFLLVGVASLTAQPALANIAFFPLGFGVGVFTFAAVTMMSDMTVAGQTQSYLGLWSIAQAIGLGSCFILSGVLHSALIGSGALPTTVGYAAIFGAEALFMLSCALMLRGASVEELRKNAQPARGDMAIA